MATSLGVIALVSGGKDSFFSILHCLANGHRLVALANLHPPSGGDEDINSFMYQTVGSSLISLYVQALDVPLYRQEIRGSAVIHDRDYHEEKDDETEDLVPLLKHIMQNHPEANAVSTGAILSTYQRTRVESVALRLGLTPLSFLWQYPFLPPYVQSSLLSDMHAVGQHSKIIKVASGGLDESFLGEDVADPRTVGRMKKALGRFSENGDGALVGEGGEFETLVVDGPSLLWKRRLEIQGEGEVIRQEGGTATWKAAAKDLRKPPTFDDEFVHILNSQLETPTATMLPATQSRPITLPTNRHSQHNQTLIFSNLTGAPRPSPTHADPSPHSIKLQLTNIFLRLTTLLASYQTTATHITHCTLLLRDMKDFTSTNALYAHFFASTNPPSRVTVAVGATLPDGLDVMLTAIAHPATAPAHRTGLHVQSHSYWAPANIGPYSQAVCVPLAGGGGREVHIAGQIPLDPPSMTLHTQGGFKGAAVLALQHLFRIARTQAV
ncbi:adenine nucleotide alpha hydrolases-like protein, partial [Karstenula rhodostoma CBS 690.94]